MENDDLEVQGLDDALRDLGVRSGRPDQRRALAERLLGEGFRLTDLETLENSVYRSQRSLVDCAAILGGMISERKRWAPMVDDLRHAEAKHAERLKRFSETREEKEEDDRVHSIEVQRDRDSVAADRRLGDEMGIDPSEASKFRLGRWLADSSPAEVTAKPLSEDETAAVEFFHRMSDPDRLRAVLENDHA